MLSDLRTEKALYIRGVCVCVCVCVCIYVCVYDISLAEARSKKGAAILSQNPSLWTASCSWLQVPLDLQSLHMRIMATAQDLQSKDLAQHPGSANCS